MKQKTAPAQEENNGSEPAKFTKKIGGTEYHVNVHFSKTSKETITDKILRLLRREVT